MSAWGPNDWVLFFGAAATFIGALAGAAAVIINALKGKIDQKIEEHEAKAESRFAETTDAISGPGTSARRERMRGPRG